MKYQWETCTNEDIIIFHCSLKFAVALYCGSQFIPVTSVDQQLLDKQLKSIHGISNVTFGDYSIRLEKGRVFNWDDLKEKIEYFIMQYNKSQKASESE